MDYTYIYDIAHKCNFIYVSIEMLFKTAPPPPFSPPHHAIQGESDVISLQLDSEYYYSDLSCDNTVSLMNTQQIL